MKKITVTIGIPAYNEEATIAKLLQSLFTQAGQSFVLKNVILVSDASRDATVVKARTIKSKRLSIIELSQRRGMASCLNTILKKTTSDALVLLNADIHISSKSFIERLVKPIGEGFDLTSGSINPKRNTKSFIQKVLLVSMDYKNDLFSMIREGDNAYTCHGPARAFSKKLYRKISFPFSVGEDMYSYLFAKKYGYSYFFAKHATLYYTAPETLSDHMKQSIRFFKNKNFMYKKFTKKFVDSELSIPLMINISTFLKYFIAKPFLMSGYICVATFMVLASSFVQVSPDIWEPSVSSKQ